MILISTISLYGYWGTSSNKDNDTHVLTSEIEQFDPSFQASLIIMKFSVQNQYKHILF